jgi:hypothetical protein
MKCFSETDEWYTITPVISEPLFTKEQKYTKTVYSPKALLHDQSFPSKTWSKFSLTKFFDRVNLHQKLCQRTLMKSILFF